MLMCVTESSAERLRDFHRVEKVSLGVQNFGDGHANDTPRGGRVLPLGIRMPYP